MRATYRAAATALRQATGEVKARAWEELVKTLDRDPLGRPYRIVLGKIRAAAPPLTEVMEPGLLHGLLDALFPSGPGRSLPEEYSRGSEDSPVPVTAVELAGAAGRMAARNTAPGPDGVPGTVVVLTIPSLGDAIRRLFDMCLREGMVPGNWKTSCWSYSRNVEKTRIRQEHTGRSAC